MDMSSYKGYKIYTNIICDLREDGFWFITHKITQERLIEGGDWEKRDASVSATSRNFDTAMTDIYTTMAYYLNSVCGDLFNKKNEEEKELLD
jgi:hypothetical protein